MAEYDAPREIVPIFNPVDWIPFGDDPLTVGEGDGRYLKLTGGVERGPVTFNQDITMKQDINFTNGTDTARIGLDGLGQLEISGTQALSVTSNGVIMNGETLDMTNGEIHKVPLIHSPNNVDLVIEGKGTADLVLKTNNVDRMVVADNGNIAMDTNVLFVDGVNNRVGVGTATPSSTLTVIGNTRITQNLDVENGLFFVDSVNNRVGVNTSTPQAQFEVAGGAMFINGAESRFWNSTYTDPDSGTLRAVKISGNGLAVNGGSRMDTLTITSTLDSATIQRSGTTTINNTQNATEVVVSQIFAPNLSTGRNTTLRLGQSANANYNSAQLTHFFNASNSDQNRLDFGFYGIGSRMSLRGDGRLGIGTTSPSQLLDVNGGNIRCSGSVQPEAWIAGQVIQMVNFNQDNANPSQYVFNTANYATWVSVSFTPRSTASRIIVQADAEYRIAGSNADTFWVRVTDAGNQRFEKTQEFANASGGGSRSGTLLPLMASYDNTTTTARNITVDFKQGTADDAITISLGQDRNWCLTITEIKT